MGRHQIAAVRERAAVGALLRELGEVFWGQLREQGLQLLFGFLQEANVRQS